MPPTPPAKKKITAAERKRIEEQISDLQDALDDAEEATPEEQAAADAAVAEEREQLAALMDKLGLEEADYDRLVAAVAAGAEERTREIVREELEAAPDEPEGTLGELQEDPDSPTPPEPDNPPAGPGHDDPPPSQHWTERRIWGRDKGAVIQDGDVE